MHNIQTKSSYLSKEMAQSGELSISISRGRSTHSNPTTTRKQAIVAVEPDSDYSEQDRRIDQGLLDASREAQNQVLTETPNNNKSWWTSAFSSAPASPLPPQAPSTNNIAASYTNSGSLGTEAKPDSAITAKHRRTVSYNKTYRVP